MSSTIFVAVVPLELLVREEVIAVYLATVCVDLLAIDIRCTTAAFEMVADPGEIRELQGAPRAFDDFTNMHGGIQMLFKRTLAHYLSHWHIHRPD